MHRDLKPTNILLHDGVLKLADFGFCRLLKSKTDMAHTMLGSPIYVFLLLDHILLYFLKIIFEV